MNPVFIKKEISEMPDFYIVKLSFLDGTSEEIKAVSHFINKEFNILDLRTFDDLMNIYPLSGIKSIKLDSNFTKIIELKSKQNENS
jgi:hypothetical protein